MDAKFRDRRFGLAVTFTLAAMVGLALDKLGGGEFVMLAGTILALYGGVEALENRGNR